MGGFLSGLGAGIGGLGEPLAQYREHVLDRWTQTRGEMQKLISNEIQRTPDPHLRSELVGLHAKLLTTKPGQDPSPIIKQFQELLIPHPNTVNAMQQAGLVDKPPEEPKSVPGTPPVGMGPGTGLGKILLPDESAKTPGAMNLPGSVGLAAAPAPLPSASTPALNPVLPKAQAAAPTPTPAPAPIAIPPMNTAAPQPSTDPDAMFHAALASGLPIPEILSEMHQPFAANEAQLKHQQQLAEYKLKQLGPMEMAALRAAVPNFDQMPEWMQAAYAAQTANLQPVHMPMTAFNRELVSPLVRKADLQPGWQVEGDSDYYRVERDRMTNQYHAVPTVLRSDEAPHIVADTQGNQSVVSAREARGGSGGSPIPGAKSTAFAPVTTNSVRPIVTTDPATGLPVTRLEPVQTRTQRGAPASSTSIPPVPGAGGGGQPSTPHGPREFPRPFTPEQILTNQQKLGQFSQVEGRLKDVMAKLPMLESLITAGKVQFNTDPQSGFIKAAINRAIPMSPEEEQLAGDMTSLMEDINVLRIPLGAAGFRGPEGWAALQSMHGNLTARPGITARVLANTMRAIRAQKVPLQRALGKAGEGIGEETGGPPTVTTQAEFDKLPSGTIYLEDGKKFKKP